MRRIFSKLNGNMAGSGSVAWQFTKKGLIIVNTEDADEDTLMGMFWMLEQKI